MKKLLLSIIVLMNATSSAHPGGDKNYVVSDEQTVIYRDNDPAALVVGIVVGALAAIEKRAKIVPAFLQTK